MTTAIAGNDLIEKVLSAARVSPDEARELYSVFARTLYYVVRGKRERGATLRQMHEIGNKSLLFVTVTMGCIGMILVYQAGLQTKRVVPDFSLLGANGLYGAGNAPDVGWFAYAP